MELNHDKLYEFLKSEPGNHDSCYISLNELYDHPTELTINELIDLLDYIYAYTEEQTDDSETAVYSIKLYYDPNPNIGEIYLLEMRWPSYYDTRHHFD